MCDSSELNVENRIASRLKRNLASLVHSDFEDD